MKAKRLHLRLFLEGVEIPCVSCVTTAQRDSSASASIQIVPSPIAYLLQPRTTVHVFYTDDIHPNYITGVLGGGSVGRPNVDYEPPDIGGEERTVPEVPDDYTRYRIFFTGELAAMQYVKQPGGRAVVLQCVDDSNYWDSVLHDIRGGLFAPRRMSRFQGNAQGAFYDLLGGQTGAIYDKLSTPPSAFPTVTGFVGGIMHLMEEVFGTYHQRLNGGEVVTSPNPFATMAELRLRLLQQIGVPPGDSTPLRLMRSQGFGSLWRRSIRGLPRQFNFRMLMQALMQYTFYSVYPLTTPSYIPPTGDYARMMGWTRFQEAQEETPVVPDLRLWLEDVRAKAESIVENADPRQPNIQMSVIYGFFYGLNEKSTRYLRSFPDVEDNRSARSGLNKLAANAQKGIPITQKYMGPNRLTTDIPSGAWSQIRFICKTIVDICSQMLGQPPRRRGEPRDVGTPAMLPTQLFRPDIWFCPPPRSNVFFPEHIVSMNWGRNFLVEPTRLLIRGYSRFLGSDPFFDQWYFAPSAVGLLRERAIITRSGGSQATGDAGLTSDLMAHEIYTGIVPFFQKMSDREMTLGRNVIGAGRSDNPGQGQVERDQFSGESLDYFQKVTNYLFYKTRFSARSVSIQGRFNPYLITGFPGLIVDAPTNYIETNNNEAILQYAERVYAETLTAGDVGQEPPYRGEILDILKGRTGVHFLGMVESITNSLNAAGSGGTTVTMSYARDHRESIEFFGQDIVEIRNRRRFREMLRRQADAEVARIGQAAALSYAEESELSRNRRINQNLAATGGETLDENASYERADLMQTQTLEESCQSSEVHPDLALEFNAIRDGINSAVSTIISMTNGPIDQGRRGDNVYQKTHIVACFETNPPQVGSEGPWGGRIVDATDITDQFRTNAPQSQVERSEIASLDEQIQLVQEQIASIPGTGEVASEARTELETRLSALKHRRANVGDIPRRPRNLSLFGTYGSGNRLPAASIRSELIGTAYPASKFGVEVVTYVSNPDSLVTLYAYRIVEDISGVSEVNFPVEDIVCPPWFPQIWLNGRIGGAVYRPMFGVGAITDPIAVVPPGATPINAMMQEGVQVAPSRPDAAEDAEASPEVIGSIMHGASVEGAVDFLVHTYSKLRQQGYDVATFVDDYTWRPVATMFDLFGSADLELEADGTITKGVEGFHSRAFGPYADLYGLAPANTSKLLGIDVDDVAARARLDVRGRRRAVVQAYQRELTSYRVRRG